MLPIRMNIIFMEMQHLKININAIFGYLNSESLFEHLELTLTGKQIGFLLEK